MGHAQSEKASTKARQQPENRSNTAETASVVSPFKPTEMNWLEGHYVTRSPKQLHLHPALHELGWMGLVDEFTDSARGKNLFWPEPILITENGTILAGFGSWRLALFEGRDQVPCLVYPFTDHEALDFTLTYQRPRRGWNAFVRIRLALTLEPYFRQKALDNMSTGGKYKGSTNLSKAEYIDVRREIAKVAGTGTGNVGKVKTILLNGDPNIIAALQKGSLKIHRAWLWRKLSKLQQRNEFARYEEDRTERRILREFSPRRANVLRDPVQVIEVLQRFEARHPGCVVIRSSRNKRTILNVGEDLLAALNTSKEIDYSA